MMNKSINLVGEKGVYPPVDQTSEGKLPKLPPKRKRGILWILK